MAYTITVEVDTEDKALAEGLFEDIADLAHADDDVEGHPDVSVSMAPSTEGA